MKRLVSDSKQKEISGHDIFAPPEELRPRNTDEGPTTPRGLHSTVSYFPAFVHTFLPRIFLFTSITSWFFCVPRKEKG
jgi:Protein of unknown function (DUF4057)